MAAVNVDRRLPELRPGWFILFIVAATGLLYFLERSQCFGLARCKGWLVVAATVIAGATFLAMLAWLWIAARSRRRFQYRIRFLLALTTVCALPFSWLAVRMKQAEEQGIAISAIRETGEADYNWEFGEDGKCDPHCDRPGPAFLWWLLGDDFFSDVVDVWLRLDGTSRARGSLQQVNQLPRLRRLRLLGAATDEDIEHIWGCTTLEDLELLHTQVSGSGLESIRGLEHLEKLVLDDSPVADAGIEHLSHLTQLRTLHLYGTRISDAGMVCLERLTKLRVLYISDTGITDDGARQLKGLRELQELAFLNTRVTARGAQELQEALPSCRVYLRTEGVLEGRSR